MLKRLEDQLCRVLDRDDTWYGVRRLKPEIDQPWTSLTLLTVCTVWGIPFSALAYGLFWLLLRQLAPLDPLADHSTWLPRTVAWCTFVAFTATQSLSMWAWNRRAWRLNSKSFLRRKTTYEP